MSIFQASNFTKVVAASFRQPVGTQVVEGLQRAAKEDPVGYVQTDAISLLRQILLSYPRVAEALVWIAEHDSKPGIRRLAREAVITK